MVSNNMPKIYNQNATAGFDAQSAFLDEEVTAIMSEMNVSYSDALMEFGRRYEAFTPDDRDIEQFIEEREGRLSM